MFIVLKRTIAYIFDVISVFLIAMAISVSPLNPNYDKSISLQEKYISASEEYLEKVKTVDKDDEEALRSASDEYEKYARDYILDYNRTTIYEKAITLSVLILYFGVFAYIFEGETVGKRLMKLRIVTREKEKPSLSSLIFRTFILFGMPFSISTMVLSYVCSVDTYYEIYSILYVLSLGFNIAIIWTSIIKKDRRGIHDIMAKTKVIEMKE